MEKKKGGIPVDNSKFSTFSTVLSTGVFHRKGSLWIFIFGSHKTDTAIPGKSHFFGGGGFSRRRFLCAKIRGLTDALPDGETGPARQWEKNSKRGLILSCKDAIMCVCMES